MLSASPSRLSYKQGESNANFLLHEYLRPWWHWWWWITQGYASVSSLTMAQATLWHYPRWVIRPQSLRVYQVNHTAYKQMWIAWELCHISTWQVDINFMAAVDISSAFAQTRMFTEIYCSRHILSNVNWFTCVQTQRLCLEKVICDMHELELFNADCYPLIPSIRQKSLFA